MLQTIINYIIKNKIKTGLLILLLIIIIFFLGLIVSYIIYKLFSIGVDYNCIFFDDYNKKTRKMLEMYGDLKIENIYIVRERFGKLINLLFNLVTWFEYDKVISYSPNYVPQHIFFIIEIKCENETKFLSLEKTHCINISSNFLIHPKYNLLKLKNIKNEGYTLNGILNKVQKKMGRKKFFNWNLVTNNCVKFSKEILIVLNQNTLKNKKYIKRDMFVKIYNPSDISVHILNCLFIIRNYIEKYILDINEYILD